MKFSILDLKLIIDFFLVEKLGLHLLDFIEVVLDQRDALLVVKIVEFKLNRRMGGSKLFHK